MEILKIILEYIKVLIWPVILVLAFFLHGDKLINIIENREIEAFGLRVGGQIDDIEKNYKREITQLEEEIERLTNSPELLASAAPSLLEKVKGIDSNLGKQLSSVKNTAFEDSPSRVNISDKDQARILEQAGFESLISQDVQEAIKNFSESKNLWPDYHNVSELTKLLNNNKEKLEGENYVQEWNKVYKIILNKYSWGMPDDIREKIKDPIT